MALPPTAPYKGVSRACASIVRVTDVGEFVTAFSNRPEVQAVQNYLSNAEWASSGVKVASGWVSANNGVDKSLYTNPIDALSAKYLTDPNATFRFDASDLMPSAVGSGEEWKAMTAWFGQGPGGRWRTGFPAYPVDPGGWCFPCFDPRRPLRRRPNGERELRRDCWSWSKARRPLVAHRGGKACRAKPERLEAFPQGSFVWRLANKLARSFEIRLAVPVA